MLSHNDSAVVSESFDTAKHGRVIKLGLLVLDLGSRCLITRMSNLRDILSATERWLFAKLAVLEWNHGKDSLGLTLFV